jgi:hypothetical protein
MSGNPSQPNLNNTKYSEDLLVSKWGNYESPLCDIKTTVGYKAISDLKGSKGFSDERYSN